MTDKTEQQKRFERAWLVKWPNDEPRIFEQDTKGQYTWPDVQDTFDGWQLCEASALERAAKVCGIKGQNDAWICAGPFKQYCGIPQEYCGNRDINGYLCGHNRASHGGEK